MKKQTVMERIRSEYLVPAAKGVRVRYIARCDCEELDGVIVGAKLIDKHRDDAIPVLRVLLDGNTEATNFHPTYRLHYMVFDEERLKQLLRHIDVLREAAVKVLKFPPMAHSSREKFEAFDELREAVRTTPVSGFEEEEEM